jgi:NAD+ kinase
MLTYKRVGITVKSDLSESDQAVKKILAILKKIGATVCIDAKRCKELPSAKGMPTFEHEEHIDVLIVIGGDGTILRAVRELRDFQIPILSVNRGAVGFLAETNIEEAEEILPMLLAGKGAIEERSLVHITAKRKNKVLFEGSVLNEAVISQGSIARLMDLRTSIHGEELTTFRADGLIIATPTGSTAYSLSAGGPIVHPTIAAMILTPINSYSFSQKPIVIPGTERVDVELLSKKNKFGDTEVILTLDGQTFIALQRGDSVTATVDKRVIKFLRRRQDTFFETLRTKLKWGERVEE